MTTAQSSHIQAHDFDEESLTLVIQFTNGAIYQYDHVPTSQYWNFVQANSPGVYFWAHIRGKYPTTLMSPGAGGRM